MILLPLDPQELAFVKLAMRAFRVYGDTRDVRMNIESAIARCHVYELTPDTVAMIEQACFEDVG